MKTFFKNISSGFIIGFVALFTIIIGGTIYASLTSVEPGDTLTSEKWNEIIGEIETLKNQNSTLNSVIPQGATIAFNSYICPSGWLPADGNNGTPDLRGVFIRGLNNFGTGTRNDGYQDQDKDINGANRTLGSLQYDTMRAITGWHSTSGGTTGAMRGVGEGALYYNDPLLGKVSNISEGGVPVGDARNKLNFNSALLGENYDGSDTHPKNIALIYCIKE